jgi:outer membrane protein assembly factor BamB
VNLAGGNDDNGGEATALPQQGVQLGRGLVPAELDPREQRQTQIDGRGVQRVGQVIWSADTGAGRALSYGALLAGDVLVYYSGEFGENTVKGCSVQAYRVTAEKLEKLWSVPGPAEALDSCGLTVSGGRVFISGEKETLCLALRDGQLLAKAPVGGARTQVMFATEDRLFLQPEGRHGMQQFIMLTTNSAELRPLGASWKPPHPPTTAYSTLPIIYPVVDGRLFIRGADGIYCYDLRKK